MTQRDANVLCQLVVLQKHQHGQPVLCKDLATAAQTTSHNIATAVHALRTRYRYEYIRPSKSDGTKFTGYAVSEAFVVLPSTAILILLATQMPLDQRGRFLAWQLRDATNKACKLKEEDFWLELNDAIDKKYLSGFQPSQGRPTLIQPTDRIAYERPYLELLRGFYDPNERAPKDYLIDAEFK